MEDWLCRRGQGGQGRKEAGCSLRSSDETDRGKGLYGGASPVSREGNLEVRHCVLGEGMRGRGEKSGVISAKCTRYRTCGCNRPLYQNQRPLPPRDSDIDTISGSFLLRFFGSAMQNLRDFALELAFGGGELQDFVSLNRMLNLLPNG